MDEYTDLSKNAQLLANERFVDEDIIREKIFFCKTLVKTTGKEIFVLQRNILKMEIFSGKTVEISVLTGPQLWSDEIKVLLVE